MPAAVTYTFSANTKIRSADMNQNFIDVFPTGIDYSPSFAGFSSNPVLYISRYLLHGKMCTVFIRTQTFGTSNATSFSMSLPFQASNKTNITQEYYGLGIMNNGQTALGHAQIGAGSSNIDFYRLQGTNLEVITTFAGWTASGLKGLLAGVFTYETI